MPIDQEWTINWNFKQQNEIEKKKYLKNVITVFFIAFRAFRQLFLLSYDDEICICMSSVHRVQKVEKLKSIKI